MRPIIVLLKGLIQRGGGGGVCFAAKIPAQKIDINITLATGYIVSIVNVSQLRFKLHTHSLKVLSISSHAKIAL